MIALGPGAKLSLPAMQRDLAANWPDLPAVENVAKKEGTFALAIGEMDLILKHVPAPIPWPELDEPCAASWLWPDAASVLKRHAAHFIITAHSDTGPIERARLLTQVTAAAIAACPAALGVYWGSAELVLPATTFRDYAKNLLPVAPPVYIWVDFRVSQRPDGSSAGYTHGLAPLGLMEIEAPSAPELPGDLRERLIALAAFLLQNGLNIKDGDMVGEDANERIRVVHADSAFGHQGRVMRLDYPASSSKKSR
jgi:uncharacterized protein DUF4261